MVEVVKDLPFLTLSIKDTLNDCEKTGGRVKVDFFKVDTRF